MSRKPAKVKKEKTQKIAPVEFPYTRDYEDDPIDLAEAVAEWDSATNDERLEWMDEWETHDPDTVVVYIPEELRVPRKVDRQTHSAEDEELLVRKALPKRMEKILLRETLVVWRTFATRTLRPLIESFPGKPLLKALPESDLEDFDRAAHRAFFDAALAGFTFAIERYADDLKSSAEAKSLLGAIRKNAAKGAATVKRRSAGKRQTARAMDRELRKTVKKKYLRVQRIAAEMRVDTRTVERYLAAK